MIEAIIDWSIRQRTLVLLATCLLVLGGIWAAWKTPVDAIPDLSDVQVIVKTAYPGQVPQVVEDQVTYPLSKALLSVPRATHVRGFSFLGDSYVYVIFEEGTDTYWARSRVLESLSQVAATLPESARPQLGPDATGVGWIYQYALVDRTGQHDLAELRSLQDWFLKFELQTVPGVAEVATVGGMEKQYQVIVDPLKLRAYDLPLAQVNRAIRRANAEQGASVIEMAEAEYMVRATGYIQSVEDLAQVPIGRPLNGVPLVLSDIADIRIGPKARRGVADLNGQGEVTGGIVVMQSGENARETIKLLKQRIDTLRASLPDGVEWVTVYDRSGLIDRAVATLWQKLWQELLVVALVCAVFLRHLRSSIVAAVSLPLGILGALLLMRLQGLSANIMSLGGIAIAIGAMSDGAIVTLENLHKHLSSAEEDEPHWQIVSRAVREVGPALFFSLAIITVSFLPVFTLQAQEGRLFVPLAFTKTWAMAVSAGLSITVIPVLLGYWVRGPVRSQQPGRKRRVLEMYEGALHAGLRRPVSILASALALVVVSFWPLSQLGSEFMPSLEEGDLLYMPTTYPAISIDTARSLLQQTDRLIATVPEVARVFGKVGRADTATDPAPMTMIETLIQLKPKEQWRPGSTLASIKEELDRVVQIPGLTNAWVMPIRTRIDMLATGIKTPVGIKVSGPDLSVIDRISADIETVVADLPSTESVYADRVAEGRYIDIEIDRMRAARYGLNIADVHELTSSAIGGVNLTQTVEGVARYSVNARFPQSWRDSPTALAALPLRSVNGEWLTLGDIADIRVAEGPAGIKSENARPTGWVLVDVSDDDVGGYVERAREAVTAQVKLPSGYAVDWSGQYVYLERAKQRLMLIVPITLLIIVALLYVNFRRWSDVIITLATLPLALTGAVWLLWFLGYNLSVAVAVGLIALAGLSVEISVLMLVYLHQAFDHTKDLDERSTQIVVVNAAARRLRPVMMTTLTVVIGLLPIMFGDDAGADVMQRIAAPMIGGMASALLLAMFVVPVLFWWFWSRRT